MDRRSGKDRRLAADNILAGSDFRHHKDRRSGRDRRKYQRFAVKGLAFAKLWSATANCYLVDWGQVLDISWGGLALRCLVNPEETSDHHGMGIFLSGTAFNIDRVPFLVVSRTTLNGTRTFSQEPVNRLGVRFDRLSADQTAKIEYLLLNFTSANK